MGLPRHNLPGQLTSFVGRAPELVALRGAASRLVTLTGPGGCGKTRLALEVASGRLDEWPGGTWLAEMAPLGRPELVAPRLATALGIAERPGRPVEEALVDGLRERRLLLVVDGCEHVLDACAELVERLLRECPDVHVLATSQEPLGIAGETVWRVEPLPPAEAAALFAERAGAVAPRLRLGDEAAEQVAEICRRLDGIPLAIELAAARLQMMGPGDVLARLDDRFRLLTSGSRSAPPRHRTLRAAMEWSHELLGPDERALFRRLCVFRGGFTLESAEAVAAGPDLPRPRVLDVLGQLVARSLVTPARDGRHRLLETLRDFGQERLDESGEAGATRRRHLEHFAAMARRRPPAALLEAEHDDLRAALDEAIATRSPDGLQLALDLVWFRHLHGHLSEGRRSLERAIAAGGTPAQLAEAWNSLGWLRLREGDHGGAAAAFEASLREQRESGRQDLLPSVRNNLGLVALFRGDGAAARASFEQAQAAAGERADEAEAAAALFNLGLAAYLERDRDGARSQAERSLAAHRRLRDPTGTAFSLGLLGSVALDDRRPDEARRLFAEALTLARDSGNQPDVAFGLEAFARLAVAEHQHRRALRLAGAAARQRQTAGTATLPGWQELLDGGVEVARRVLGPEAAGAAWREGAATPLAQAIAHALAAGPAAAAGPAPLSRREQEVAALVEQGLTNAGIGRALGIATRTAETHVQHILDKLGLSSRAQIAAWAAERRLAGGPAGEA